MLQESAVAPENLAGAIAGEDLEGLRRVDYGLVGSGGIDEDEADAAVDGA